MSPRNHDMKKNRHSRLSPPLSLSASAEVVSRFPVVVGESFLNGKIVGIYKITSPIGKVYIGQSTDIKLRFRYYKGLRCKSQTRVYNSFLKHGVENHTFEILHQCEIFHLNSNERLYQDLYNSMDKYFGLNCKLTKSRDKTGVMSEATKEKLRIINTGKPSYVRTEENRRRTSERGKLYRASDETKLKNRMISLGKKYSPETNKKKGTIRFGKDNPAFGRPNSKRKKIFQLDENGKIIKTYESMQQAANETKLERSHIRLICQGKYKTAKGLYFKYA